MDRRKVGSGENATEKKRKRKTSKRQRPHRKKIASGNAAEYEAISIDAKKGFDTVAEKDQKERDATVDNSPRPPQKAESSNRHTFDTNVLDHCETPKEAYHHLNHFLEIVGKLLCIQPSKSLRIWDPYYCDGSMKTIFQDMGFTNILHENADFYQLIRDQKIPEHDILVTNPPYSDDHIPRLLDYVVNQESSKVTCLLLPNWVARQPNYDKRFSEILEKAGHELFYLSPVQAYTYTMPGWVSQEDRPEHVGTSGKTTPYLSSWYLVVPKQLFQKRSLLDQMDSISKQQKPSLWVVAKTVKGLKWKIKKVNQRSGGKEQKSKTKR